MNYLGIDYGRARIGVAISTTSIAQPLGTIENNSNLLSSLIKMVTDHGIDKVIIGLPEASMEKEVRKFAENLAGIIQIPIEFQDETLSTKDAQKALMHKGQAARRRSEHEVAAAIILQNFLDSKHIDDGSKE